jgi:hypothetical protein
MNAYQDKKNKARGIDISKQHLMAKQQLMWLTFSAAV